MYDLANRPLPTRIWATVDILAVFVAIQIALWNPASLTRVLAVVVTVLVLVRCWFFHVILRNGFWRTFFDQRIPSDTPRSFGLPWIGHWKTWLLVLSVSLILSVLTGVIFYLLDLWSPTQLWQIERTLRAWLLVKVPTVFLQQLIFQLILIPTLFLVTGNRLVTVIGSAIFFGLLHFPNPLLMLLTAGIGCFWFALSMRQRSFVPILVSHFVLAVLLGNIADEYVFDMRVGKRCLQKWPTAVCGSSDDNRIWVYPRQLEGEVELVTQQNELITIRGNAFDPQRAKAPSQVFVTVGEYSIGKEPFPWEPNSVTKTTVRKNGEFELQIPASQLMQKSEIRLFARHRNGWSYPINKTVKIKLHNDEKSDLVVCLYPLEISGVINRVQQAENRIQVFGTAHFRNDNSQVEELVAYDGEKSQITRTDASPIFSLINNSQTVGTRSKLRYRFNVSFPSSEPNERTGKRWTFYAKNRKGLLERLGIQKAKMNGALVAKTSTLAAQ